MGRKFTLSYSSYLYEIKPNLYVAVAIEIFTRILDCLSDKKLTTYQISYATKIDPRTVRKYLDIIDIIQSSGKVKKEITGARVLFKKERTTSSNSTL